MATGRYPQGDAGASTGSSSRAIGLSQYWESLAYRSGPLHRLDPRLKIVTALGLLLLAVSIPAQDARAFVGFGLLWGLLLLLARLPFRRIVAALLLVAPFVAMTTLFWLLPGTARLHRRLYVAAVLKSVLGVAMLAVLASTSRFADLLDALRRLGAPSLLVRLLGLTYRFFFVFVEELWRMRRALTARGFQARWLAHAPVLGRMLGVLFLRAYERGERVHLAMAARGYGREPPPPPLPRPATGQLLAAGSVLAAAAVWRFLA